MRMFVFAAAACSLLLGACSHARAQVTTSTIDTTEGAKGVSTAPTSTAPASATR